MTLRERPGDQVLPAPGQQDVSTELQRRVRTFAEVAGATSTAELIAADLEARILLGVERYGQRLQAHNGRDVLRDLYEEMLDATHYAQQLVLEAPAAANRLVLMTLVALVFDAKALLLRRESPEDV